MTTPTPRQAALERLATALKDRWYQIADTQVIDHCLSRAWDQLADAALAAVEQAAPEGERRFPNEHDAALRLTHDAKCEAGRGAGETFCVNGCACGERSLADARTAMWELVKRLDQHEELSDILAWAAVVAAVKEEKRDA